MGESRVLADYEAVSPARREPAREGAGARADEAKDFDAPARAKKRGRKRADKKAAAPAEVWSTRRAHALSFAGLFAFIAFVYFRPYETFSLPWLSDGAQILAILTLMAFIPAQLGAEGNLTARPREVNLALLLLACAVLSIPLAISPAEAFEHLQDFAKVILIFVVMVNVVRTERRLRLLIVLALATSVVLSVAALNDYRAGRLAVGGVRVKGLIGGLFDNPNDLALHLVTMAPLAVCLMFGRRGPLKKVVYGLAALLAVAGVVVTFSRGGFLGLVVAAGVLGWKLARRNRPLVFVLGAFALAAFVLAAPSEYGGRLSSIFGGDATGSSSARQELFWRSVIVALRYPAFGVGLGNFHFKSIHEQVSHNSYTQVAAEMGLAAMLVYCLFVFTPLRRLARIEREALSVRGRERFYYLAVGLQASLWGFAVSSFFASVAHLWYVYFLVGYAVCLRRLYAAEAGETEAPAAAEGAPPARPGEAQLST